MLNRCGGRDRFHRESRRQLVDKNHPGQPQAEQAVLKKDFYQARHRRAAGMVKTMSLYAPFRPLPLPPPSGRHAISSTGLRSQAGSLDSICHLDLPKTASRRVASGAAELLVGR